MTARESTPTFCEVGNCTPEGETLETRGGRTRCDMHEKRWQRGARGAELSAPVTEKLTPKQRLLEACGRWIETDPEDDEAYEANERAVIRAAKVFAPSVSGEIIREALAQARARGVRLGAPPRIANGKLTLQQALAQVSPAELKTLTRRIGSISRTAMAFGVSRNAVSRALRRAPQTGVVKHRDRGERRAEISSCGSAVARSAR